MKWQPPNSRGITSTMLVAIIIAVLLGLALLFIVLKLEGKIIP